MKWPRQAQMEYVKDGLKIMRDRCNYRLRWDIFWHPGGTTFDLKVRQFDDDLVLRFPGIYSWWDVYNAFNEIRDAFCQESEDCDCDQF